MAQNWREVELAAVEHFEVSSAVHPSLSAACDVQSSHGLLHVAGKGVVVKTGVPWYSCGRHKQGRGWAGGKGVRRSRARRACRVGYAT